MAVTRKIHPELPVFRISSGGFDVLYAPGHAIPVESGEATTVERIFQDRISPQNARCWALATQLETFAQEAVYAWEQLRCVPFHPECLTIYLSNQCNLRCAYCYSATVDGGRERGGGLPIIDETAVKAAARLVARSCHDKAKRFTFALQGGGEPTTHWDLLKRTVALSREAAQEQGIEWWGYIATNGVLVEERVRWLAAHFDRIGLSCDGSAVDQDAQRPMMGGADTSEWVRRTARVLGDSGVDFTVRVTVTPQTADRQAAIVRYACETLGARTVRLEPAFGAGPRQHENFAPADAPRFVDRFLEARAVAASLGCEVGLSSVRLDEIHGPFCNVLREVLNLTPDGTATACFLATDGRTVEDAPLVIGRLDRRSGEFVLDRSVIDGMRRRATQIPARCHECANVYHCARDCPDVCPVLEDDHGDEGGFRCLVQKRLGEALIAERGRMVPTAASSARVA